MEIMGFMLILLEVLGLVSINKVEGNLNDIFEKRLPSVSRLIQIDRDLSQLLVAERSMIFASVKSELFKQLVNKYEQNLFDAEKRWDEFKKISKEPVQLELIDKYEQAKDEWKTISKKIVDGRKKDTRSGRRLSWIFL